MKFVKASDRMPSDKGEPKIYIVKWTDPLLVLKTRTMTARQLADEMKWGEGRPDYEWLDESPSPDGWVRVEDRLPDEHRRYLCMMFYKNCFIEEVCLFEHSTKQWLFGRDYVTVSHWQPLPATPADFEAQQKGGEG